MADPDDPASLPTRTWTGPPEPSAAPSVPVAPVTSAAPNPHHHTGWQPPAPEELQPSFPLYEIRRVLGRGGMGAVYLGWQKSLDRFVAIKILPPQVEDSDVHFSERFKREAKAMARFSHPGIVSVYDAGETTGGLLYFVMEYIEGTDVQKMVAAQGHLSAEHALAITAHVCDALAYAHKRGVIHRDIKPSNIMIDAEGQVKVADFGLAKVANEESSALHTSTHVRMGTPDFMAPEATMGIYQVDHRVDLYAVGVMLYQMLTGQLPRGRFAPPSQRLPGLDVRLDAIVDHALQPDPEKRYSNATEIRADLDQILTEPVPHRSAVQQPPPPPSPPPEAVVTRAIPLAAAQKPKGLLYVGVVAAVLLLATAGYFVFKPKPEAPAKAQIEVGADRASPSTATKAAPFENTLGMKFIPVPIIGGPTGGQQVLFSVWDTRAEDYETFVKATKRQWPKADFPQEATHPAVALSWEDAQAFCQWLTAREREAGRLPAGWTYRLPSDHEWSCAVELGAREDAGSRPVDKNSKFTDSFVWGTQWPPPAGAGNYAGEELQPWLAAGKYTYVKAVIPGYHDGYTWTSPVGSFAANRFGLYDLGGNMQQWCEDWYDEDQKDRVLRGSSWSSGQRENLLSSHRSAGGPTLQRYGFRCVLGVSVPPSAVAPTVGTSTTPAAATKDAPFKNTLGMKFVPVPGTKVLFSIWDTRVQDYEIYARVNKVSDAWQWQMKDGVRITPEPDHPVVGVSLAEAWAFCQWLTEKERAAGKLPSGAKYRLPMDEEWSQAVGLASEQGATPAEKSGKDRASFPWGLDFPPKKAEGNYADTAFHEKFPKEPWIEGYTDGFATTSPVGSFAPNKYGIYDLGGNVWQWCEDLYNNNNNPAEGVLRGASWASESRKNLLSSYRNDSAIITRSNVYGFRCVLESAPVATPEAASTSSAATGVRTTPAATPDAATKDAPFVNTLGMRFVPVPGTKVLFGIWDTRVQDYAAYAKVKKVDDSWTRQGRDGVGAGRESNHPVVGVSWDDAQVFCQWLTEKEIAEGKLPKGMTYRLPTDEEWSRAVGLPPELGTTPAEKGGKNNADFPWGKDYPPAVKAGNYADETYHAKFPLIENAREDWLKNRWLKGYTDSYATTSPVGSFPANADGLYDMGGNVWQWCEDLFDASHTDHVLRGAAWSYYERSALLSSTRYHAAATYRHYAEGFRCVLARTPVTASAVVTPATATKDQPFENTLGMKFVPVPILGGPTGGQRVLFGVWDTRVQDYAAFVKETKRVWQKVIFEQGPTHPAVVVSWEDARAFCAWLTERERNTGKLGPGESYRLPSDQEWSCAVGIGGSEDLAQPPNNKSRWIADAFPWGTQWPPPAGAGNYAGEELSPAVAAGKHRHIQGVLTGYNDGYVETAPVGSFTANRFGLYDMGGNVWQWCEDWFDQAHQDRVVRGASWETSDRANMLSSNRGHWPPTEGAASDAFRCVLDSTPPTVPVAVTPGTATKDQPFENTLGMKFVPVPIVGGPTGGQRVLFGVWDTRVQDYEVFVIETKRAWPKVDFEQGPTHPAVTVSWDDARAFCAWLTERESRGRGNGKLPEGWSYRLPSDHEWSCAVGIGDSEDAALPPNRKNRKVADIFPWGAQWPPPARAGNYAGEELRPVSGKYTRVTDFLSGYNDGFPVTAPVGSFAPNRFGLCDMGGNVWQWCEDWFDQAQKDRVLRGAAWDTANRDNLLSSNRGHWLPTEGTAGDGFRCVLSGSAQ